MGPGQTFTCEAERVFEDASTQLAYQVKRSENLVNFVFMC
jgi:hypothetical protein